MRRTEREVQNTGVCNEQETYDTSQGHLERHGKRGLLVGQSILPPMNKLFLTVQFTSLCNDRSEFEASQ